MANNTKTQTVSNSNKYLYLFLSVLLIVGAILTYPFMVGKSIRNNEIKREDARQEYLRELETKNRLISDCIEVGYSAYLKENRNPEIEEKIENPSTPQSERTDLIIRSNLERTEAKTNIEENCRNHYND